MLRGDYENNEDWLGFGQSVLVAANGILADLFDGMPDNRKFDQMEIATREMVVFGNYVIIDHQNGEYSCLAHLKKGSIPVKVGHEVQQGQMIGRIGASGIRFSLTCITNFEMEWVRKMWTDYPPISISSVRY